MQPIRARLAVYLLLDAENEVGSERDPEVLKVAKGIASSLSESEFETYAGEYDRSRVSWELARAVGATAN